MKVGMAHSKGPYAFVIPEQAHGRYNKRGFSFLLPLLGGEDGAVAPDARGQGPVVATCTCKTGAPVPLIRPLATFSPWEKGLSPSTVVIPCGCNAE